MKNKLIKLLNKEGFKDPKNIDYYIYGDEIIIKFESNNSHEEVIYDIKYLN